MTNEAEATDHVADATKLPKTLQALEWQSMPPDAWDYRWIDSSRFLVAIPVSHKGGPWSYDIEIITIRGDEDYFGAHDCYDETSGWVLGSIDFMVPLDDPPRPTGGGS